MTGERDQNTLKGRRPGETTLTYRRRISRGLGSKAIKLEGEDFSSWAEQHGEKGVLTAYLGWRDRFGANFSGDFQGADLEEGAAMVKENEGMNAFVAAVQGARGKEIDMNRIMVFIDKSLRDLKHGNTDVRFMGEFKSWCLELMSESRPLGPKAEEIRRAS